jgi:L-fuculose-phosphate aldolase
MIGYMTERQARKAICAIGDKMYNKGFVAANDGNISVKISDDTIIVTPTGVSKGGMSRKSLVKMKLDGTIIGKNKPSSEVKMHIRVYQLNPSVKSVVHAHPPASTAFAIARIPMDRPIMSESILTLGVVPVAEYALPGTNEVPDSIEPFVKSYNAVLLANHGLLTWGDNITQAMYRMESAEQYCNIMIYLKQVGEPVEFSSSQVSDLIDIRKSLGIETGGVPVC